MPSVRIGARGRALVWLVLCWVLSAGAATSRADFFSVTNLVTNNQAANPAQLTDSFLKNAWGISRSGGGPFWVSDNGSGVSTLYSVNPTTNAVAKVTIGSTPDPSGGVVIPPLGAGNPTGQVFNTASATGAFNADNFLFVSEDGTISGWRSALGTTAERFQVGDVANVYKGTTLDTTGGHTYLLSANFRAGTIDVLKGESGIPDLSGRFVDPGTPAGFAPFNIQVLGNRIYVTYALQDAAKQDDVAGAGNGFVTAFDLQGNLLGRIGTRGALDSPWGMAIAPASFGSLAGSLLVGNFGDGRINVFSADPSNPAFLGQLLGSNGQPITIDGLWGLIPGNDGNGGSSQKIYFSAGPNGEANGLFGVLEAVPEPGAVVLELIGVGLLAGRWSWKNGRRNEAG